jgi:hypothetical protein
MRNLLSLIFITLFTTSVLSQGVISTGRYSYVRITKTADISDNAVVITSSFTRTVDKVKSTLSTKYVPKWYIVLDNGTTKDSTVGLTRIIYGLPYNLEYAYYASMTVRCLDGVTRWYKGSSKTFTLGTITPPDTIPSAFTFTDVANAHLDSTHTVTTQLGAFDSCYFYASGNQFKRNSGGWVTGWTKVFNGDNITLTKNSSGSYSTAVTVPTTAGGITDTWSITTMAQPATGDYWYVGLTTSGNGNALSWTNKHRISDFNWSLPQPGDIIYLDGGATDSSINYSLANITLTTKGTLANPITITNGVDVGHNGQVVFKKTASADNLFTFDSGCYYTIINDLKIYGSPTHVNDYAVMTFYNNTHGITFQNCYIDIRRSYEGIRCESGASATNIKFLHNTIISSVTTSTGSADLFWLGGVNSTNWEIGWCNLITKTVSSGAHRDIIQVAWGFNNVGGGATPGYFKLHHSFIEDRSAGASGGGIESEHLGGKMLIYNNVFKSNCTGYGGTGAFSLLQLTSNRLTDGNGMPTNTGKVTARIYNNTFYASTNYVSTLAVRGFDSLFVQNNIFYSPTSGSSRYYIESDKYTQLRYQLWDYNQYTNGIGNQVMGEECDASAGIACGGQTYTWTQWRNAGFDANSTYNTDTPTFVNINANVATGFALQAGSDGIDDGTTVASVTDDYSGTSRPQVAAYDIGAFEYIPPEELTQTINNVWADPVTGMSWVMETIANQEKATIVMNPDPDAVNSTSKACRLEIVYGDDFAGVANGYPRAQMKSLTAPYGGFTFPYGKVFKISWDDYIPADFDINENSYTRDNTIFAQFRNEGQSAPILSIGLDSTSWYFEHYVTNPPSGTYYRHYKFGTPASDRGKWIHWELNFKYDSTSAGWSSLYKDGVKVDSNSSARTMPVVKTSTDVSFNQDIYTLYLGTTDSLERCIDNTIIKNVTDGVADTTRFEPTSSLNNGDEYRGYAYTKQTNKKVCNDIIYSFRRILFYV